jgi:hypothetical protein
MRNLEKFHFITATASFKHLTGFVLILFVLFVFHSCFVESTYIEVILQQWLSIPAYSTAPCYVQGLPLAMGNAALRPSDATAFPFRNAAFASDAECEFSTKTGQGETNALFKKDGFSCPDLRFRHCQRVDASARADAGGSKPVRGRVRELSISRFAKFSHQVLGFECGAVDASSKDLESDIEQSSQIRTASSVSIKCEVFSLDDPHTVLCDMVAHQSTVALFFCFILGG